MESWKERLPELMVGYKTDDVWNMDETGVFWRALPDSGFGQKGKECKGGKKSKHRITVAFFVSATGVKEKPIVIWKSANPRCLKRFDRHTLPVQYFSQTKAWMTGDIMVSILTKLNARLALNRRSILLLLDNAGCHPDSLQGKFTNINICFLPANTTSKLQPLDLGIIQNFKVHYRHFFLRYVLSKIDECETASEVVKSVNVLVAIRWVAQAWVKVKAQTISKCFKKAGILNTEMDDIVSCDMEEDDPFRDADEQLVGLINDVMPQNSCSPQEYVNGEDTIPVCNDMDDATWEEDFLGRLGQEESEPVEEDREEEQQQPVPKLKTFKEAISALEDVQSFLEDRGHIGEAAAIGSAVDSVVSLHISSMKQKTLQDHVTPRMQ